MLDFDGFRTFYFSGALLNFALTPFVVTKKTKTFAKQYVFSGEEGEMIGQFFNDVSKYK